ncbi:hypothetical protein N0V90_006441 [Kalmusia sp. IMI 367209]|nr:hypothetical protein N0V90_006441 [Kalmusia sp. IMI 367209]
MAFSHNPMQDLGHFVMPHLIEWWKTTRAEHVYHFQKIAELRAEMRKADKELGPCKKRDGLGATTTNRLIRRRRSTHGKVKPLESHIYTLKRHLASFEKTFDAAIQSYARSSCLALTTALHTKLPRELRDMIYTYLLDSNTVTFVSNQVRHQALHPTEPIIFALPLFLDLDFTARPVTSEIMYMVAKQYAVTKLHESSPLKLSELAKVPALDLEYPTSEFFVNLRMIVFPFTVFDARSDGAETSN